MVALGRLDDAPPLLEPIASSTVPPFLRTIEPERMRMPLQPGAYGPVADLQAGDLERSIRLVRGG